MATQPHNFVTAEQFYQLPQEEGREFELLDGEIIEMSSPTPRHNLIVSTLTGLLFPALSGRGLVFDNTDFSDGKISVLRPDLVILLGDKLSLLDLDKLPVTVPPDIVVEVISPSESWFRVERRISAFSSFGVQEVWTINPVDREIKIHSANGITRLRSDDTLQSPLLPGWPVAVAQLFER